METKFLFPNKFRVPGWILLIPALIIIILMAVFQYEAPKMWNFSVFAFAYGGFSFLGGDNDIYFGMIKNNILDEIVSIILIIGAILVAFSKEKTEDEYIMKIRLESLVWATYINYGLILFCIIFIYGISFFWALLFNMFSLLILFIVKYRIALLRSART